MKRALRAIRSDFLGTRISPTRILLLVAGGTAGAWLWGLLNWWGTADSRLPFPGYLAGLAVVCCIIYPYLWWRENHE